jgi:hypothetical protein
MVDPKVDGQLQVTAALALLNRSHLIEWSASEMRFAPVSRKTFEDFWRQEIHPVFGRLMCWMLFSAGAELLAKGACLCAGIDFRRARLVPAYPHDLASHELEAWSGNFLSDWRTLETVPSRDYRTLGDLIYDRPAPLEQLCAATGLEHSDTQLVLAAYVLLAKSIRNRDAHAYVPQVRDQHHSLVSELFVKCFTFLITPLKSGTPPMHQWPSAEVLVENVAQT